MRVIYCDMKGCKREIPTGEEQSIEIGDTEYDVCPECFGKFQIWAAEHMEEGRGYEEEEARTEIDASDGITWYNTAGANGYSMGYSSYVAGVSGVIENVAPSDSPAHFDSSIYFEAGAGWSGVNNQ